MNNVLISQNILKELLRHFQDTPDVIKVHSDYLKHLRYDEY